MSPQLAKCGLAPDPTAPAIEPIPWSAAQLCWRLLNLEGAFEACGLAAQTKLHALHAADEQIAGALSAGASDARILTGRLLGTLDRAGARHAPVAAMSDDEARFIALQCSPNGLLAGCVLQNIADAANAHEEVPTLAHAIHSWHVGGSVPARAQPVLYRHLLESVDLHLPPVHSRHFAEHPEILRSSWELAAYRLSLSLRPDAHRCEILGAALLELAVALPAPLEAAVAAGAFAEARYVALRLGQGRVQMLDLARQAIHLALAQQPPAPGAVGAPPAAERIALGFATSLRLLLGWERDVAEHLRSGHLGPWQAMLRLVRLKGRHAVGYHARQRLGQHGFDELIVRDPQVFVQELAGSRWVSPGRPDESLLFTKLLPFGGPMFRVFSDAEVGVMRDWVASLPSAPNASAAGPTPHRPACAGLQAGAESADYSTWPLQTAAPGERNVPRARELYHRLLQTERFPKARAQALAFAQIWLARSASALRRGNDALPFEDYSHDKLRHWFERRAKAQVQSYAAGPAGITKSRDEVVDEAVQLCPMVLIDGAWLQGWTNAGLADTRIGALLYKIYSDEIGNGQAELNHPNIYRALMRQMGVLLPDFRSAEFAQSALFDDSAFAVPAFWLSVSQFPRRFLAETLGLNLAMELSGVGGAYRSARDELRHYGFSTLFVDLHNTIDNVSSGHSAMALQAIELHMDDAVASRDQCLVSTQWQRVWTGFRALSTPRRRWTEVFGKSRYAI